MVVATVNTTGFAAVSVRTVLGERAVEYVVKQFAFGRLI